jgi:hypothetical protein
MTDEQKAIMLMIEELNNRIASGTISPEEEEVWREEIQDLQTNFIIGTLLDD